MPYAPIITADNLKTHIYRNVLDEITRKDDTIIDQAIATGIAEAKIYLAKYDLVQMFGSEADDLAASFSDPYLTNLVKDIVSWHLINLGNPNLITEKLRTKYKDAIDTLKAIQKGQADPQWPYIDSTETTAPGSDAVTIQANPKRSNYY